MRAYLELGLAGFRRYSTYRLAIVAGVFTQSVFGFIRRQCPLRGHRRGGRHPGRLRRPVGLHLRLARARRCSPRWRCSAWSEVADRITCGEIAVDLARPVDLLAVLVGQRSRSGTLPAAGSRPAAARHRCADGRPGAAGLVDGLPARICSVCCSPSRSASCSGSRQPDRLLDPRRPRVRLALLRRDRAVERPLRARPPVPGLARGRSRTPPRSPPSSSSDRRLVRSGPRPGRRGAAGRSVAGWILGLLVWSGSS